MTIRLGTLCFLVRIDDPAFRDRTVEVTGMRRDGGQVFYLVDAAWLRELLADFGRPQFFVPRANLVPISHPDDAAEHHAIAGHDDRAS